MSGILGIWNLDGRPVEPALLARMSAQIAHRGTDGAGFWREGPVGLAHQMLRITPESLDETQPLAAPSGAVIVFDGRLDNREEVLGLVDGAGPGDPDCALVLAAYCRYGDSTPEKLNGDFAFAIWDPSRQRLLLARDGLGVRPLFYARAGDGFLFASEIKPILAHPDVRAIPNDETLADWVLRLPGEDNRGTTFFESIYSVPPAHQAIMTRAGIAVRRYWDFDKTRQIRLAGFDEYTEAFRHYFDQALRRRMRSAGPVTISVSGGLDSSAIYCRAETLRRAAPGSIPPLQPVTHSFPPGSSLDEEEFVAEIERQYGTAIHRIPAVLAGPVAGAAEEIWRLESPVLPAYWSIAYSYFRQLKNTGAKLVVTGHFADEALATNAYLVDYLLQGQWRNLWDYRTRNPKRFKGEFPRLAGSFGLPRRITRLIRRIQSLWASPAWDTGAFTGSFRRRILERERAWQAFPGPFASAQAACVYRTSRSRFLTLARELLNRECAQLGMEWVYPFLDRDLLGFLMAIPGDVVSVQELKKKLLRSAMRGVLPPAIAGRKSKAMAGDIINGLVRLDLESLLQQLHRHGRIFSRAYVNSQALGNHSEDAGLQGRNVLAANRLGGLLGLELWLALVLEGGGIKIP